MKIQPRQPRSACVRVPGSKSLSHRFLTAAALAGGDISVQNCLISEDTLLTMDALKKMGVGIERAFDQVRINGKNGQLAASAKPLFLGNSGTSLRLVCALAALGQGTYTITGTKRMQQRPIQDLLDGLQMIHVPAEAMNGDGCPPVQVQGGKTTGGTSDLRCGQSSQYLSAMLLIAPCTRDGIEIRVTEGPVSKPYVDMTLHVMQQFGIQVEQYRHHHFRVAGDQNYRPGSHTVEPDCSQAGYFWAVAAITGGDVKVLNTHPDMLQGDIRLLQLLESMGCRVRVENDGIRVAGGCLRAIDADMSDMPDMVPTLAVVAAFAEGKTHIRNIGHLRIKESNRIEAVVAQLKKMGVGAEDRGDGLDVVGGSPHGARIDTYDDHRIAMSFAVAGMQVPGVEIADPGCVAKSFPDFWEVLEQL